VNNRGVLKKLGKDICGGKNKGQTLVEFGLIIALVSLTLILVLGVMSNSIRNSFEKISDEVSKAAQ
jgi:Flp pilus assembly pilin Flp